jgi:RES domain-containing protein
MTQHPDYKRFRDALQRIFPLAIPFRGTLYRACDPTYANTRDLVTGEGSQKHGGRWNPPRSFATVYLAQSVEGAIAETLGLPSHYGFDPAGRLPLTLVALDTALVQVVDFADARVRKSIGVTLAEMNACDWRNDNAGGREAVTQALGRAAFELGTEGIIVPSAVKRTFRNFNVFPRNLGGKSSLTIRRSEKLPPPPAPGIV